MIMMSISSFRLNNHLRILKNINKSGGLFLFLAWRSLLKSSDSYVSCDLTM